MATNRAAPPSAKTGEMVQQAAGQMTGLATTGPGEFLLYQTEGAQTRVQVRFQDGGIWLTQAQLAELYQCSSQNITQHIRAIYESGELVEEASCKPYLQVRQERGRQVSRSLKHYNLEMVLAVGYRAKSHRGGPVRKADVSIAKNYLSAEELDTLNRIVTAYIEVAELQAQAGQPMTMRDWAAELDNFLRLARKDILTHAGKVSAEAALTKAQAAYALYQQQTRNLPSRVERDFDAAIAQPVKQLEKGRKKALPGKKKGGKA